MPKIYFLLLLPALLTIACIESTQEPEILPNIILMMGDDHGWDEVGYNGHPFVKTPILDQMAAQGVRMDRFYAAHPSCSPTRASFLTGRHPNRCGTFSPNWSMRPEEITIADVLTEAGYTCVHLGKWHVGPVKKDSPTSPGAMGFSDWLSHDNFFELDPVLSRDGNTPEKFVGESSDILVQEAIHYIEKTQREGKPFLIVIWYGSPHEPYSGLPEDLALYDQLPDSLNRTKVHLTSNETGERVERNLRDVLMERYAEITAMDRSIGTMRDYLEQEDLRKNTLLWYCGDNGTPASADRTGMTLRGQKGTMYEGGLRVPGVLEWPRKMKAPRVVGTPMVTSDILPTLAAVVEQPLPSRPIDGINILPYCLDESQDRDNPIFFWEFPHQKVFGESPENYIPQRLQDGTTPLVKKMNGKYTRSFRNYVYHEKQPEHFTAGDRVMMEGDFKLIAKGSDASTPELEIYNLAEDPAESTNLINKLSSKADRMYDEMYGWQDSVLTSLLGGDY